MSAYVKASTRDRVCSAVLAALKDGVVPEKDHLERIVRAQESPSEKRTELITVRLSEREALAIKEQAKAQRVSIPAFVRSRLFLERKRFLSSSADAIDVE